MKKCKVLFKISSLIIIYLFVHLNIHSADNDLEIIWHIPGITDVFSIDISPEIYHCTAKRLW